jgi:hypothetical protein
VIALKGTNEPKSLPFSKYKHFTLLWGSFQSQYPLTTMICFTSETSEDDDLSNSVDLAVNLGPGDLPVNLNPGDLPAWARQPGIERSEWVNLLIAQDSSTLCCKCTVYAACYMNRFFVILLLVFQNKNFLKVLNNED